MPSFDRICRVSRPAVQETIEDDFGYGTVAHIQGGLDGVPTPYLTSDDLTRAVMDDRFGSDGTRVASAFIPYSDVAAGVYTLAWGGTDASNTRFDVDAAAARWIGVLYAPPVGSQTELIPADDDSYVGDLVVAVFNRAGQGGLDPSQQIAQQALIFRVAAIGAFNGPSGDLGMLDISFTDDNRVTFREDFRQGEIRRNSPLAWYGIYCERRLSYTRGALALWARREESGGTSFAIDASAQSDVTLSSRWVARWRARSQVDVLSALTDDEGTVWRITDRSDGDRRRTMALTCERVVPANA